MLDSLRAQTAAIVVTSLILSNLVGYLLYSNDRLELLLLAEAFDVTERAAGVSRLLRDLPSTWEADIVTAADSRAFRVWTSDTPPFDNTELNEDEEELAKYFRGLTPRISRNSLKVWFRSNSPPQLSLPSRTDADIPIAPRQEATRAILVISIDHGGGHWLNFFGPVAPTSMDLSRFLLINLVLSVVFLGAAAIWLIVRVTSPLFQMTQAASQLGRNLRAKPLPESGPREVAIASRAFNLMQRRLIRHVEGRTTLLAAISHDLRTPITQMRLRTELMPPSEGRERFLSALDEMAEIISSFLDYSRVSQGKEPAERTDLGSLVESICDDFSDAGHAVECRVAGTIHLKCKRLAMKRVLVNIIENAVVYGGSARVTLWADPSEAVITVQDSGPGIPEDRLDAVFEPFFRLEPARSKRSEGVGLGLSIALMIVEDHGGTISVMNQSNGGLSVEIRLPF